MPNKGQVKMTFYTETNMLIGYLIAPLCMLTPFPNVQKDARWIMIEMLEEEGF